MNTASLIRLRCPASLALLVASVVAEATQPLPVPAAFRTVGAEYGIPPNLLYAIALTESGRELRQGVVPWPWTLNVRGRGLRFESREAATSALARLLASGERPDVGLMQVNWRWHGNLLSSPEIALDPWYNLRAGSSVLASEYEATGDWWRAVGRYHSRDPDRAARYRARVARWYGRIER